MQCMTSRAYYNDIYTYVGRVDRGPTLLSSILTGCACAIFGTKKVGAEAPTELANLLDCFAARTKLYNEVWVIVHKFLTADVALEVASFINAWISALIV